MAGWSEGQYRDNGVSLTELEKIIRKAGWRGMSRVWLLNILNLRYLLEISEELSSRQVDTIVQDGDIN